MTMPPIVIPGETPRRRIGRSVNEPRETDQNRVSLLAPVHQELRPLVIEYIVNPRARELRVIGIELRIGHREVIEDDVVGPHALNVLHRHRETGILGIT